MIQIRPVSDLRNKFPEIESIVNSGKPVYLTKNGYGAMDNNTSSSAPYTPDRSHLYDPCRHLSYGICHHPTAHNIFLTFSQTCTDTIC